MSFQQQNSRDMENPFSIRNYAFSSRQKNVAQSWPFQQKYLKLCLNHGINDVLPPLETHTFTAGSSLNKKNTRDFGKNRAFEMEEAEKRLKQREEYSSLHSPVNHLCGELAQLTLSFDGDNSVGQKQHLTTTIDLTTSGNQSSAPQNTSNMNMGDKGAKRKGRMKKKSLADILAVAKHCVLDGHDRIYVSGGGSSSSQAWNLEVQRERNVKDKSSGPGLKAPDPTKDCSLIKKHQRHDDSATGTVQFSKRSCTMGVPSYIYNECKLKPWGRKSSCKTTETEKPGGCERKALETSSPISAVKLQDRHAY